MRSAPITNLSIPNWPSLILSGVLLLFSHFGMSQSREFLFNSGINYMLADKEMAIEQFTKSIAMDANFSAAYFYRGVSLFKLGRYNEAITDFDKVSVLDSTVNVVNAYKGFAYRQLGEDDKSLSAFSLYMNSRDKMSAVDYNLIAKAKMEAGDLSGAIEGFEAALSMEEGESQFYYLYQALFSNHEYSKALEQINNAITENSEFYGYYLNRGNTQLMLGEFKSALNDYDYALTLEPSVPDSYYLRGRALDTLNQHNKAILDFNKAIELNPKDGTYFSKRGNAKFASGNRDAACLDWTIANNLGYYQDFNKIKTLCE